MWVFGYGSLVWKADFKYECKLVGYIKGYFRRFYQHSIDHRGVPEKPGRVVTLIPSNDPDSSVWGIAYKIKHEDIEQVTTHLDYREKNYMAFFIECDTGPASIEDLAMQVISCRGPSGSNKEYVYNLAEAMRRLAPDVNDDHLFSLEAAVKKLDPDVRKNS